MATTQYIGARYVPLFADPTEWNNTRTYEPLTIVMNEGNSYTSKQYVPKGIDLSNKDFWALTGNYNAQVEAYRKDVTKVNELINGTLVPSINENTNNIAIEKNRAIAIEDEIKNKYIKHYSNVSEMKTDNSVNVGFIAFTEGFYKPNDGGGNYYIFTNDKLTANEMDVIECSNNCYATLVKPNSYITPKMLGASETLSDNSNFINRAFELSQTVIIDGYYTCASSINVINGAELTITGLNFNNSAIKMTNGATFKIGGSSNVNELRINNISFVGDRTQKYIVEISYITNVTLNQVNFAESSEYLINLNHADIVFIDKCTFAGSNQNNIWQPCSAINMTSANPIYLRNCNIWNVKTVLNVIGTTRYVSVTYNWIEAVQTIVNASNVAMQNCVIDVSKNNIVFSLHNTLNYLKSRIVKLDNISVGFDILVMVNKNYINYYTSNPTEGLVEVNNVTSTLNIEILKNIMFTRLQQMNAYALIADARNDTHLNYAATTNADANYGCKTEYITNTNNSPRHNVIANLNVTSNHQDVTANQKVGDIWYDASLNKLYYRDNNGAKAVSTL